MALELFILDLFYHPSPIPHKIYFPECEPLTKSDKRVLDSFFCSKYFKCSILIISAISVTSDTPLNAGKVMFHHGGLTSVATVTVADENKSELE